MADIKLTAQDALAETPATGDLLYIVDVSDTTDGVSGSSKKITRANLVGGLFDKSADDLDDITAGTTNKHFTATDETKLDGIEALADVTDTANVTAAGALMDSEIDADLKTFSLPASTTISTFGASIIDDANEAAFKATVNLEIGTDVQAYSSVLANTTASFTTADETKLDGIEALADVTDATNVSAAGGAIITSGAGAPGSTPSKVGDIYVDTTGDDAYIAVGTASSADWEKSNDGAGGGISDGDKGDITVSGSGATWTIDNDVVTYAKMQNVSATDRILGRDTSGAGDIEEITPANVRTMLNVADGANAYVHPNHSGDVTSVADGATTIASGVVTLAKMANLAQNLIIGRITGSTGVPEALTAANVRTIINVEDGADVTDTANVTAAGALMDSEVDADLKTLSLPASTTISTFGASIIDDADEATFKATVNLEIGTDVQAYNAGLTSLATNWVQASASGASSLDFHEDTDNGSNKITITAPSSIASDKTVTFQDVTGTVLITGGMDVAVADGGTGASTAADALINLGLTATASELNALDGITSTVTELNYTDGVTSAIQTQINAKPTISSGAGAPGSTPTKVGDIYIDTTGDDAYLAVGTASSADWEKTNDGAGGGISDGDKGDITVSSSGATWTIDNDVVTYAKMQNVSATDRILGRITTGAGDIEELTAANVRTIINVEDGADVTDTANVTAAGALMDSEVDADIKTLSLPASTTISTFGASIIDDADEATFKATVNLEIGVDVQAYNADLTSLATNWVQASASGASSLDFHEDTDNGTNKITLVAPASIATDKTVTFQDITGTVVVTGGADLTVADGGTGASTLTGLLQGNGTSAITGITNSSTVGQVLRVTGASTYAWGALDLADTDAVTGTLPAGNLPSASTTASGIAEAAIASEVNTGTDTARYVTPDALAGSNLGTRVIAIQVLDGATAWTTGDGKAYVRIPAELNGYNVIDVDMGVITKSTSGNPTVMIARGRQANATTAHAFNDVLSTALTIDANDFDSKDAGTAAVINGSNDDLATGDILRVDIDTAGTGTAGLNLNIVAQLP